jgi:cell wall-associated NlpC family hydrolase
VKRTTRTIVSLLSVTTLSWAAPAAQAKTPDWVKPAVTFLADHDYLSRSTFAAHRSMRRADFRSLMHKAFGNGYNRKRGRVTAGEVSAALSRALHDSSIVDHLDSLASPDGWTPDLNPRFGAEVMSRELGLRHDWPLSDDRYESSTDQHMRQADVAYAVWQAKTSPDTYSGDLLGNLALPDYGSTRRKVIKFALSLVGKPYIYGGEWGSRTPSYYPYGAQVHGGFDCSGFVWYVLRQKTSNYQPLHRHYAGWKLDDRTAAQMAAGAARRLTYRRFRPGDLVFFGPYGRDSSAASVYHTGIFLGRGWMVHSSGSRDGVSISFIGRNSWWHSQIAWGRRIIH